MSNIWKFTWVGPGISTTTGKRINETSSTPTPTPNIGDAIMSKTGNIVTMIPENINDKYKLGAWQFNIYASPSLPFTTSSSLQTVQDGIYVPDQNYFFPVDLHTSTETLSNTFYLFLNTEGFFSGLFISEEAIQNYPLHERKFLSEYWDPSSSKTVPDNTSLQYVVNGETSNSSWYVITSLENAVITLPNGSIQYSSSGNNVTKSPSSSIGPNQHLYNRLLNENKQINEYIALIKRQQYTDVQKAQYETPKIQKMTLIYDIMYYLYYILLFILCFYMFMVNDTWDIGLKIAIAILFVLYPLTVSMVQYYMYKYAIMMYNYTIGAPIGGAPVERNIKNMSMVERSYNGIIPLGTNFTT